MEAQSTDRANLTCSGIASLIGIRVQSKLGIDDGAIARWLLNQLISVRVETAGVRGAPP